MKFRYYNDSMKNYLVIFCSDGKAAGQSDPKDRISAQGNSNEKMPVQGNSECKISVQGWQDGKMSEQGDPDETDTEDRKLPDNITKTFDGKWMSASDDDDPHRREKEQPVEKKQEAATSSYFNKSDAAKEEESIGYQYQMISANHITGLLPCSLRKINGELLLYVDITSLQSMDSMFRTRKMSAQQQKKFLYSLSDTGESISRFLLDSRRLLSDPRFIFYNYAKDAWYFVYYPKEERGNYQKLFQFMCDRTDPSDKMAAAPIYQLCDIADSPNFVLDGQLLDHLYDTEKGIYTRESDPYVAGSMSERPGGSDPYAAGSVSEKPGGSGPYAAGYMSDKRADYKSEPLRGGYAHVQQKMRESTPEDRDEEHPMREPYDVMDRGQRTWFREEQNDGLSQERRNAADAGQGWMEDTEYSTGSSGSYTAGNGRPHPTAVKAADGRWYQAAGGGYRLDNYATDGYRYQAAGSESFKVYQSENHAADSRQYQTTGTGGAGERSPYGSAGREYRQPSDNRNPQVPGGTAANYRWANAENLYGGDRQNMYGEEKQDSGQSEPPAAEETQNQLSHVLMTAFICLAVAAGAEFFHVRFQLKEMADLVARSVAAAGLAGCVLLASYGVYLAWKRKKEERNSSEESSQPLMQPTLDFRNGQLSGGIMMGEQQRREGIR